MPPSIKKQTPIDDESRGVVMPYSSGTTARPKGIAPPPPSDEPAETPQLLHNFLGPLLNADETSIYLCPALLYHAAPLGWTMAMQRIGSTTIVMEQYDAAAALALIEKQKLPQLNSYPQIL